MIGNDFVLAKTKNMLSYVYRISKDMVLDEEGQHVEMCFHVDLTRQKEKKIDVGD